MLKAWLLLGLCGLVSCYITCPDGKMKCKDQASCCLTDRGYKCCPYPNAVCCADLAHCCPSGFLCNLVTQMCEKQGEPKVSRTLLQKVNGDERNPADKKMHLKKSSVVYCDNYYTCPDGTTCCRHPKGGWTCCPYSPARCCLDGFHCCPYGQDCDYTYTHCIRQGMWYPFSFRTPSASLPASLISVDKIPLTALEEETGVQEDGVIRCDSHFYCPKGSSCCRTGEQWSCCPYPLATCCADGKHCCQYGYACDPDSQKCTNGFSGV